jgi:hypothetical protein
MAKLLQILIIYFNFLSIEVYNIRKRCILQYSNYGTDFKEVFNILITNASLYENKIIIKMAHKICAKL